MENEKFTIRKGIKEIAPNGEEIPSITPIEVVIMHPSVPKPTALTKEDVWGNFDLQTFQMIDDGMVVANSGDTCPYFGDQVPYKSVTVVCQKEQETEVRYWLEYVHGTNSVEKVKKLENGKLAIRSNYMAW